MDLIPPDDTPVVPRTVRQVNPLRQARWDNLLLTHPDYTFFHSAAWARVLCDTYHYHPTCFTVNEDHRLLALLPVMEVNSWLTGRRGISLPFTDDCHWPDYDALLEDSLIPEVIRHGRRRGWRYVEWRGGKDHFAEAPASHSFLGHELSLVDPESRLFAGCESAVRRAIRKAEHLGVTVGISRTRDAVETFYALHCQTRRKHGLPPQSLDFFRNIYRHVLSTGLGWVFVARHQGTPIAAAIFFHLGAKAIYKYGASAEAQQHLRGNNLVIWEAIKWYVRHGYTRLDFGRTSLSNQGLRRFKLAWGTQERRIDYVRFDFEQETFVTGADQARGWHNRIFKMLPENLSRLIGAALYRHVA